MVGKEVFSEFQLVKPFHRWDQPGNLHAMLRQAPHASKRHQYIIHAQQAALLKGGDRTKIAFEHLHFHRAHTGVMQRYRSRRLPPVLPPRPLFLQHLQAASDQGAGQAAASPRREDIRYAW